MSAASPDTGLLVVRQLFAGLTSPPRSRLDKSSISRGGQGSGWEPAPGEMKAWAGRGTGVGRGHRDSKAKVGRRGKLLLSMGKGEFLRSG